jgi:hypothetical protein
MKFLVVKVKDKDLYFNSDEMEGPYVCDTPMLMDKDQVDWIMKHCDELYNYDSDVVFTNNDLEIREVEVNLI